MFVAEAKWLARVLGERPVEELSPLLNVGSSTSYLRETYQPWTERLLFAPLRARGVRLIHLDRREGEGIDLKADIADPADLARIRAAGARSVLCCNILEHVTERQRVAEHCIRIAGPGGYVFVTVPYSYPRHRDPIDTLYRPAPEELQSLFAGTECIAAEIVDTGESYLGQVKKRPWIIFRQILRAPFPYPHHEEWRHSMKKLYWLFANYRVTCAVFKVPAMASPSSI